VRILFDQGTPAPLRLALAGHEVRTAFELGWSTLSNGELLAAAEGDFEVLITTDRNLRHQQSVTGRGLAILVLPTTSWPRIQRNSDAIIRALASTARGQYLELTW
jgi:hypothetical protein